MDYFAIATHGFFPTPTPTGTQRMAFASTWGYLNLVPTGVAGATHRGFYRTGLHFTMA